MQKWFYWLEEQLRWLEKQKWYRWLKEQTWSFWLVVANVAVFIVWLLSWWGIDVFLFPKETTETRGTFGDKFGAVNALFSGLAFASFLITVWMQAEELRLTREELQKQAKALEDQAKELEKTRLENGTHIEATREENRKENAKQLEILRNQSEIMGYSPRLEALNLLVKNCEGVMEKLAKEQIVIFEKANVPNNNYAKPAQDYYRHLKEGNHTVLENESSCFDKDVVTKYKAEKEKKVRFLTDIETINEKLRQKIAKQEEA